MQLFSWLCKQMIGRPHTRRAPVARSTSRFRPRLEVLEGRDLPSFSAPVVYTSGNTTALVTGDVNGDSKPDLINASGANAYLRLNNGNGTFGAPGYIGSPGLVTALAVVSGQPDIWTAENPGGADGSPPDTFTLVQLNSNGTQTRFNDTINQSVPISSLAVADLAGNGQEDLVGVTKYGSNLYVASPFNGNPFGVVQAYSLPQSRFADNTSSELALGDFNVDGKSDIVITNARTSSVEILLNNGNGTFGTEQSYSAGGRPTAVAVGDFFGNGNLDIVTANSNGTVSVLPGKGNGTFAAAQNYALSGPANSIAVADFNRDGYPDLVTTDSTEMDLLLNNGNGTFAAYQKVGPAGSDVVAADFNGDGYPDLAEVAAPNNSINVVMNNANRATPASEVVGIASTTTAVIGRTFPFIPLNTNATVRIANPDSTATLPTNYTFTAADDGVHTFSSDFILKKKGTQTITVKDTKESSLTGTVSLDVM